MSTTTAEAVPTELELTISKQVAEVVRRNRLLRFQYLNRNNHYHEYVISPEAQVTFTHWGHDLDDLAWCMHGQVVTRDGYKRPEMGLTRRRTFRLSGLTNITIVPIDREHTKNQVVINLPDDITLGDITSARGAIIEASTVYVDWEKLYNKDDERESIGAPGRILLAVASQLGALS